MIAYPAYKDSSISWIGALPDHWKIVRLGSQFLERREKVSDKEFSPLSVTKKGILPQLDTAAKSNDGDNRKKVCMGDFVINSRSDRKGSSGISHLTGSVSLINIVLKPLHYDKNYIHYFFRSHPFKEEFYRVGHGIVADLWTTRYEDMRKIMIPFPLPLEQKQIAQYLDWKTTKINKFIKAKKELIALFNEQKQNIINEAVTKGINRDVKMNDSGIEWLGQIPQHWQTLKHARIIKNIEQGWSPVAENRNVSIDEWGVIKISAISHGHFIETNHKALSPQDLPKLRFQIKKGDFLLTRGNTPQLVGDVCVVKSINEKLLISDLVYRITFVENVIPEFLMYWFLSIFGRKQIESSAFGSSLSMVKVSQRDIKSWIIISPPISEQQDIVAHINKETFLIDKIIARAKKEIELIQEYQTRLISDVVTGKIDVRSIQIPDFEPIEPDIDLSDENVTEELVMEDIEE